MPHPTNNHFNVFFDEGVIFVCFLDSEKNVIGTDYLSARNIRTTLHICKIRTIISKQTMWLMDITILYLYLFAELFDTL